MKITPPSVRVFYRCPSAGVAVGAVTVAVTMTVVSVSVRPVHRSVHRGVFGAGGARNILAIGK